MKLIVLFLMLPLFCFCQIKQSHEIYIVGRGTLSKKKLVGDTFNNINKNMTHVGIGILESDSLKIYNVSLDKKNNNSALVVESLDEFQAINDIFYLGIWKLEVSENDYIKIKDRISLMLKKEIKFDSRFGLDNGDNNLYCSEFVQMIINTVGGYDYKPNEMKPQKTLKSFISKDKFIYFPTDFFLKNKKFQQVYLNQLNFNL
jgi:hypothetical protein